MEDGVGLYQEKGGPVVELRAGETHYCPPGVVHWHGASPKEGGTQFNVSRGGITWLAEVTDAGVQRQAGTQVICGRALVRKHRTRVHTIVNAARTSACATMAFYNGA